MRTMKLNMVGGLLAVDLVDREDNVFASSCYQTSGEMETELQLESPGPEGRTIELVPRIKKNTCERVGLNDSSVEDAINLRAKEIGHTGWNLF